MIMKAVIILFMLAIVFSLGSGLYFLLFKQPNEQTVKALTWRIGLSLTLFIIMMLGLATGILHPHHLPFQSMKQTPHP